jgi:hypothetical protein
MRRLLPAVVLVVAACSSGTGTVTTTLSVDTTAAAETSTTERPPDCPAPPYEMTFLPVDVGTGDLDPDTVEQDVWTSVPGTNTTLVPRSDDSVAVALVRGTLPPVDWPGDKGEATIDGTRAAVGPHPDGSWVAGWYEEPGERCDLYTMVFYPPWSSADVEAVLAGMNRVGG